MLVLSVSPLQVALVNHLLTQRGWLCLPRLTGSDRLTQVRLLEDQQCIALLFSGRQVPVHQRQWRSLLLVLGIA